MKERLFSVSKVKAEETEERKKKREKKKKKKMKKEEKVKSKGNKMDDPRRQKVATAAKQNPKKIP